MKKAPLVLVLSLVANAALVGFYLLRPPAAITAASNPAVAAARPTGSAATRPGPAPPPAARAAAGKAIDMAAAKDLVARMRAAGFPIEMIAVAAQSRLMEQYYARYSEIMGSNSPVPPFWSSQASTTSLLLGDPARQAAQRALSNEMTNAMKDLLGADYITASMSEASRAAFARQYSALPVEKITQLQQLMQDFSQQQSEVLGMSVGGYGVRLPEDTAKLAQIERDQRAAIVALLTPEELENYDLRSSNAALQLKSQLIAFEPTENEYRALFKLQQAFDNKYPPSALLENISQEVMRERAQAQQKLKEDMVAALPPDRAEVYRLATENGAASVARIVNRLDMPMSTVGEVMAVQKEIQAQATALRTDRTLAPDVRNQALVALQQQANERIAGKIGANGLAAYKSTAGSWIQNLVPPPPGARGGTPAAR